MVRAKIVLPAISPFRLDLTVWALRRREKNAVDRWDGSQYVRVIVVDNNPVQLTVTQETAGIEPQLNVVLHSRAEIDERTKHEVGLLVDKMLGVTINLEPFYTLANSSDSLKPLVEQLMGVKPPRFASIFEGLINSIACQQVTLDLGIVLLNRLSEKFGLNLVDHGIVQHAFPEPADVADASDDALRELGFSRQKARAMRELAANIADNKLDLTNLEGMTDEEAVAYLSTIRGIGRWSAEYVLLRGLGRLDIFPGDDIGAQNNLQRLFLLDDKPNYQEIKHLTSRWGPYEGVVYFHLLLEKLHAKGLI
jgi:DNA-3-methyladenine glycosylase II